MLKNLKVVLELFSALLCIATSKMVRNVGIIGGNVNNSSPWYYVHSSERAYSVVTPILTHSNYRFWP